MSHPEAFSLLCSMFRLCGFGVEPDHLRDGDRAGVIEPRSGVLMGYAYADPPRFEAVRGPTAADLVEDKAAAIATTCATLGQSLAESCERFADVWPSVLPAVPE